MNGIGDYVTSLKETRRLAAQVMAELKGDAPGHPFRGNQYEGGGSSGSESNGEKLSFEDVYGDPEQWKPKEASRYGSNMLHDMGFDAGDSGNGLVSVSADKNGFSKLNSTFDKVTLASKTSSVLGDRYHSIVDFSKKKNKIIAGDYLKKQYTEMYPED